MVREIKSQEEFNAIIKSDESDNVEWCPHCGRCYVIDWTEIEKEMMMTWDNNRFSSKAITIQEALPNRNIYERELMRYAWKGNEGMKCCEECDGGIEI